MFFDWLLMPALWLLGIALFIYGFRGLVRGKIRAFTRSIYVYKDLQGKWAYIYSSALVIMGTGLLAGLAYNAVNCGGLLVICQ